MAGLEQVEGFKVIHTTSPLGITNASSETNPIGSGLSPTGEASPAISLIPRLRREGKRKPVHGPQVIRPETRTALRIGWKEASEAADRLVQASRNENPMDLVIAADELDKALSRLWDLREARDINWKSILNHAQGLFRQAFTEKRVEMLTLEQCLPIKEIVDRYLGPATKTLDDLTEVVRLIDDAGFDPYFAISGAPEE